MSHYFPECEENNACICDTYTTEWDSEVAIEEPVYIPHVGFENILENVVNKPLLWCDECHYYHNTIKDCPYN